MVCLDVTFSHARVFDADNGDEDADDTESNDDNSEEQADTEEQDETQDETGGTDDNSGNQTTQENDDEPGSEDDSVERQRGFYVLDLDGETVDLTTVIGDRAKPVFEGILTPGVYEKLELHVEDIEGIVDGSEANVKVPSEKLQITHEFEVSDGEALDFVFDINVVKRGQGNDYNLTPVISESGVAGEDVEVEEVDESAE